MEGLYELSRFAQQKGADVSFDEPMKNHTTFRIGGPADLFIEAESDVVPDIQKKASELQVPLLVIGNGSNLLISDKGIDGAVLRIKECEEITLDGEMVRCKAGVKLARLCIFALEHSLSGLEFAYGIPGSVGGALYMNAGAYGGEMKDVVTSAVSCKNGETFLRNAEEMNLCYRSSCYKTNGETILSVCFGLKNSDKSQIKQQMDDILCRRKTKQPLEYPSAGSTFKRPEGYFAAALIEECGLKGFTVGGAQVSTKHTGFVINCGNATCEDVQELIRIIRETVLNKKGVKIETEVIYKGRI